VRPVAHAGFEMGYLSRIRISWGDNEYGRGPMGIAIREGRVYQAGDLLDLPGFSPWKQEAIGRGYRSTISVPLFSDGQPFGALAIYSDRATTFGPEEVDLLQELAGDLAYGIMALRGRLQRDQMRRNLEEKAAELRRVTVETMQAEEVERRRIARILHDELQQLLVAARYALDPVRTSTSDPSHKEALNRVDASIAEGLGVSRSLTTELSPPVRGSGPLIPVLQWLALQMKHRHRLDVAVRDAGESAWKSETLLILLYQAVRELLFNVVKHAKVQAAEVTVRDTGGGVQVEVADNGAGFDPTKTEQAPRTAGGYGLFTIRERVAYLGGRVEVQTSVGSGSRFTVWLPDGALGEPASGEPKAPLGTPVAGRVQDGPPAPTAPKTAQASRRIRVLIADDHPVVRRGLALALKDQPDIEIVAEAQTGREAVKQASQASPDVVVMDMRMPDLGGIEATRLIHDRFPAVRIIGFSAMEDAAQVAAMRQAGAVGYVVKSDPPGRLLATIRACFESSGA